MIHLPYVVGIDPPCALINANDRLHFRAKAKLTKAWREAAAACVTWDQLTPFDAIERASITVAIRFPTNRRRDVGNYYPTAKAILDGLVDAGVLPDDNDQHVIGPDMRRDRPNGPLRVTVTIRDLAGSFLAMDLPKAHLASVDVVRERGVSG
jgi:crossover junction endodeoxyribonuclease RusA